MNFKTWNKVTLKLKRTTIFIILLFPIQANSTKTAVLRPMNDIIKLPSNAMRQLVNARKIIDKTLSQHVVCQNIEECNSLLDKIKQYGVLANNLKSIAKDRDKFEIGEKPNLVMGDIHGYIYSIVEPLVYSNMATLNENRPLIIFDMKENREVTCDEIIKKNNYMDYIEKNIIMLPNLKLKENSGKLVLLGDYFDRGDFSIESFYLLVQLHNQQKSWNEDNRPLVTVLGNHDTDFLVNPKEARLSGVDYKKGAYRDHVAKTIKKYVEDGHFKLNYADGGIIYQHSWVSNEFLTSLAEQFKKLSSIEKEKYGDTYNKDLELIEYFNSPKSAKLYNDLLEHKNDMELMKNLEKKIRKHKKKSEAKKKKSKKKYIKWKNKLDKLKAKENKWNDSKKLRKSQTKEQEEKIKLFSEAMNRIYVKNPGKLNKAFFNGPKGPVWTRNDEKHYSDPIKGAKFMIGHIIVDEPGVQTKKSNRFYNEDGNKVGPADVDEVKNIYFLDAKNYGIGTTIHEINQAQGQINHLKFGVLPKANSNNVTKTKRTLQRRDSTLRLDLK